MKMAPRRFLLAVSLAVFAAGCDKPPPTAVAAVSPPAKHEHHPPHGGTPVVLGNEAYHLELVCDPDGGRLQAFVLDGEMENFIRTSEPSIEITATVGGVSKNLVLSAVANPATGETVGDTSLFEGKAEWLKSTPVFDGVLKTITIRGTAFADVRFNYPMGNDTDGK